MPNPSKEQEYREEAESLAHLPKADQLRHIAILREIASNPEVPKRDRQDAADRANALEKLLKLTPK
jgi:hypothetical protein